jgi:hypothetical protein
MSGRVVMKVMVPPAVAPPRGAEALALLVCRVQRGLRSLVARTAGQHGAPAAGMGRSSPAASRVRGCV